MSGEAVSMEKETEEIAGELFDEIRLVCNVLVQVDLNGGQQAFGTNSQYQEAVRLARLWGGMEAGADEDNAASDAGPGLAADPQ